MVLHPLVGPWLRFQFLDPIHSRKDSLDGESARRKVSAYTQYNTDSINTKKKNKLHGLSPRANYTDRSLCYECINDSTIIKQMCKIYKQTNIAVKLPKTINNFKKLYKGYYSLQ
jgi:hypothetical protein